MYSVSNFLDNYSPTSKTVRILNSSGKIVFTLMVCNYQKSSVSGNTLNIVLEDNTKEYKLAFQSNSEAKSALSLLKQAIDSLKPNCNVGGGGTTDNNEKVELLTITNPNILSPLSAPVSPLQLLKTLLYVNGKLETPLGPTPAFSVTGNIITWNNANTGYDLILSDNVIVRYFI
jgi:hypothetical protein